MCVVSMSQRGMHIMMTRPYQLVPDRFPNYADCHPVFVKKALENAGVRIPDAIEMAMWGLPVGIILRAEHVHTDDRPQQLAAKSR
jgi:hypothetical protein